MAGLHISVSMSGGASLGAYQAGTMAALLVAVEHLQQEEPDSVAIDAFGGASAGSLVAVLSATSHLCGMDPVAFLRAAWVDGVSLDLLFEGANRAPLGSDGIRRKLEEIVVGWDPQHDPRVASPIALSLSLTGLRGLTYRLDGLRGAGTIPAVTYDDWGMFLLEPGFDRRDLFHPPFRSPVDVALASAANPTVFAPKLLDRSGEKDAYEAAGITDLPEHGHLWFADGGLMQSEPVGRVLEASQDLIDEEGSRHLVLLVHPRSEGPSTGARWSDAGTEPEWLHGLSRALEMVPAKNLYDDLRRVVRDNRRLALSEELSDVLARHLDGAAAEELGEVLRRHVGVDGDVPTDLSELVEVALGEVGGTTGKRVLDVDVLTPLLLSDEDEGVEALLAGALLGDFGGFLDRRLRYSDFVLGYATTRRWLSDGLEAAGVAPELAASALGAVEAAHEHDWRRHNRGGFSVGDLPRSDRLGLSRLAGRVFVAALGEFLPELDLADRARAALSRVRRTRDPELSPGESPSPPDPG